MGLVHYTNMEESQNFKSDHITSANRFSGKLLIHSDHSMLDPH